MSIEKSGKDESFDEYDAPDLSEYEDEERVELTCKVCGMPVRLGFSQSEEYTFELVCGRCGVVPSIEVEGDVVSAIDGGDGDAQ
jgi:CRISPR/Cas system-associated protein Cas10 (large subunit of type III CRISPR-Cas system)